MNVLSVAAEIMAATTVVGAVGAIVTAIQKRLMLRPRLSTPDLAGKQEGPALQMMDPSELLQRDVLHGQPAELGPILQDTDKSQPTESEPQLSQDHVVRMVDERGRAPLTKEQLEFIQQLRNHLGIRDKSGRLSNVSDAKSPDYVGEQTGFRKEVVAYLGCFGRGIGIEQITSINADGNKHAGAARYYRDILNVRARNPRARTWNEITARLQRVYDETIGQIEHEASSTDGVRQLHDRLLKSQVSFLIWTNDPTYRRRLVVGQEELKALYERSQSSIQRSIEGDLSSLEGQIRSEAGPTSGGVDDKY